MNYEQKYKNALERAKKLQKTCDSQAVIGWCEYLFPELKESEDEKIRKKLICFVENWKNFRPNSPFDDYAVYTSDSGECDKILAWLEKQGEKKTEMIEKACEWLDNELPKYIFEGRDGKPYISVVMVDYFKKAMKGGKV